MSEITRDVVVIGAGAAGLTAANALRFALEEAAPVSLRGARLRIGEKIFAGRELISLYRSRHYPLHRKNAVSTRTR